MPRAAGASGIGRPVEDGGDKDAAPQRMSADCRFV